MAMTQGYVMLIAVVVLLAALPWGLRWLQRRLPMAQRGGVSGATPRLLGALAVGPQQRVMTIVVGEGAQRTWLVIGVTSDSVHCLHTLPQPDSSAALQGLSRD